MSAVNALVKAEDYNNIRSKIVNVLGRGSTTSGWGQPVLSSAVSTGIPSGTATRISIQEYATLATDLTNAYRHIFGSEPSLPSPSEHALIKFNTTTEPINRFDTFADQIVNNRFTVAFGRTQIIEKGQIDATWPSATYGAYWNKKLTCLVQVQFTTATQARYFFNSGGDIRFTCSRTNGTPGRQQNTSWSNILDAAGVVRFGGNIPQSGISPTNGGNYYRLTSQLQAFSVTKGESDYSVNEYRISAAAVDLPVGTVNNQAGIARRIDFFIEWIDNYVDKGDDPADPVDPGDEVDGTILLSVETSEATGALDPSGIFTVESPVVGINAIIQESNTQLITPSTYVPINNPLRHQPVNAPPSSVNAPNPIVNAPPTGLPGGFPEP